MSEGSACGLGKAEGPEQSSPGGVVGLALGLRVCGEAGLGQLCKASSLACGEAGTRMPWREGGCEQPAPVCPHSTVLPTLML